VNWIVDRAYRKAPGSVRDVLRADMTATRRYSLSDQTRKLLDNIEKDVKIYVLLVAEAEEFRLASELIDEYGRYGNNVKVETIYTATNPARLDSFYETIRDRYAEKLKPIRDAIATAREALRAAADDAAAHGKALGELSDDKDLPVKDITLSTPQGEQVSFGNLLFGLTRTFDRVGDDFKELDEQLGKRLDRPTPNYGSVLSDARSALSSLVQGQYRPAGMLLQIAADDQRTPDHVKEKLLGAIDSLKASQTRVSDAVKQVEAVESPEAYDSLRAQVNDRNAIVLMDDKQERVLNVGELFRRGEQSGEEGEERGKLVFLGEEKITGALTSLILETDPLVVFCTTGSPYPLSPQAQDGYYWVSEALRNAHFQVQTWNPMPRQPQPGMPPMPGQEAPRPEPGQRTVWVYIQSPQMSMSNPMASMADGQIVTHIRDRMAGGDGAMLILAPSAMPNLGGARGSGAFDGVLADWGLTAQLDRVIFDELTLPDRTKRARREHEVSSWSKQTPITAALGGMPGLFIYSSPIIIEGGGQPAADAGPETTRQQGVEHWPLVVLEGSRLWAETDFAQQGDTEYDKTTAKDRFVVAVAAQNDKGNRLAVFADPLFASNLINAVRVDVFSGAQFQQFPANSELFVNSVYWLGGLDEYIAAGARSQDIRRVDPKMSKTGERWIEVILVAGLPLLVLAAGIGVWFVRRSG
jgi:hypothetical protein